MVTRVDVDELTPTELYARLADTDVALPTLTDEELAAVSPTHRPGPVPVPRADRLEGATREVALGTALRGLAARRWVRLAGPGDPGRVVATGSLGLLLGLRQAATAVATVERLVGGRTDVRHLHVARDGWTVLEEQRHPGGQHTFLLRCLPRVAHAIAVAIAGPGWASVDGPPVVWADGEGPPEWEHVDRVVAAAEVVTRITTLVREDRAGDLLRSHVSFAAGAAHGVWALAGTEGRVTAAPVPAARLAGVVAACLTPGTGT